jgi:acetyltransferase-like isoleucine patch superfamily enzyme
MTIPRNLFPINIVEIGMYSYGSLNVYYWGDPREKLVIGNYVSISSGVRFLLGGNHNLNTFSTYPFKVNILNQPGEAWTKGKIVIEDDVWIGMDAMILSGVKVGKGSVISAGSIVTKDVPPYAIVAGNPARIVKYRFNNNSNIIQKLYNFDFSQIDPEFIERNLNLIYEECNEDNLKELITRQ